MVGLSEIVLDIIVLSRDAKVNEFPLECATLLEEAMYLSSYFHFLNVSI